MADICSQTAKYSALEIINFIVSITGIIIMTCLFIDAFIKLPKQTRIHRQFKTLFWLSIALAFCVLLTTTLSTILCVEGIHDGTYIAAVFMLASYFALLLTLLITLLTRVQHTFVESVYALSKRQQRSLIVLCILCALTAIVSVFLFCYLLARAYQGTGWAHTPAFGVVRQACIALICMATLLYVGTATWCSYLFATKIMQTACASSRSPHSHSDGDSDALNAQQTKFIDCLTRYVGLFSLATLGSIVCVLVLSQRRASSSQKRHAFHGQLYMILCNADTVLNVICLYLQFTFNVKHYHAYCKCLSCWKSLLVKRLQKHMENERVAVLPSHSADDNDEDEHENGNDIDHIESQPLKTYDTSSSQLQVTETDE